MILIKNGIPYRLNRKTFLIRLIIMSENIIDHDIVHGIQDLLNVPCLHKCFDFRNIGFQPLYLL